MTDRVRVRELLQAIAEWGETLKSATPEYSVKIIQEIKWLRSLLAAELGKE